jgi:hypothetical protein
MTKLLDRVYHYLTDDIAEETPAIDGTEWLATHPEEEQ